MMYRGGRNKGFRVFCLFLLIIAVFLLGSAQNYSHAADGSLPLTEEWRRIYAGPSIDYAYDLAVDSAGDVYLAGRASGPRGTITKYNPAGAVLWNYSWSCSSRFGIAVDTADAVYITGRPVSGGALLLKYHANGTLLLNCTWGASHEVIGYDIAVSTFDNIYIAGQDNTSSAVFAKFNSSGGLQWERSWNPTGYAGALGLVVDNKEGIYIVGEFSNFTNSNDVFLLKYNSSGDLLWTSYWHSVYESALSVVVDNESNCYVSGLMNDYTNYSALLLKFDSEGYNIWNRTLTGDSFQCAYGVALTGTTLYLACGDGYGALAAFTTAGVYLGNLTWSLEADSARARAVAASSNETLYLAGDFQNATTKSTDRILVKYTANRPSDGIPSFTPLSLLVALLGLVIGYHYFRTRFPKLY